MAIAVVDSEEARIESHFCAVVTQVLYELCQDLVLTRP